MEIKISLGFGRKGQHKAQEVNRNLEVQVQALSEALRKEKAENAELREQIAAALRARVAKGRRMQMMQGRLELVQPVKVVPAKAVGAAELPGRTDWGSS